MSVPRHLAQDETAPSAQVMVGKCTHHRARVAHYQRVSRATHCAAAILGMAALGAISGGRPGLAIALLLPAVVVSFAMVWIDPLWRARAHREREQEWRAASGNSPLYTDGFMP